MPPRVLYRILPLSERHVRWCFQDLRTTLSVMLKMRVDILNMHSHVLAHFIRPRRPKLATLAAQHDRALADGKLRMGHTVTRTRSPEALRKTEGAAEPVNRFFYVFVDKYGYHCCSRCRPVDYHIFPLTSDLIGRGDYIRRSNTKLGHYRAAVYLKIPHYALLLFALVVSLRWLGASISALGKTMGIFQSQNVSQGNKRPNTLDLLQQASFRILRSCDLFDLSVIISDRLIDSLDLLQQWRHAQNLRQGSRRGSLCESLRGT